MTCPRSRCTDPLKLIQLHANNDETNISNLIVFGGDLIVLHGFLHDSTKMNPPLLKWLTTILTVAHIYHHASSCIIMHHHESSCINMHHHAAPYIPMHHHIYHHASSYIIMHQHAFKPHLCHWGGRVMAAPIHPPRVALTSIQTAA